MKRGARIGGILGSITGVLGGLYAGVYFGGYGAIILLSKLAGGPVSSDLLTRIAVLLGMVVGVVCIFSVATVIGAVLGTLTSAVVHYSYAKSN